MIQADILELVGWLVSSFGAGIASSFVLRAFVKLTNVLLLKLFN